MKYIIPVDAYLITFAISTVEIITLQVQTGHASQAQRRRVERVQEAPSIRREAALRATFASVNRIWAPASIQFRMRSCHVRRVQALGDTDAVDESAFLYLARHFPAANGVSLLLVHRFQSADKGGQAAEAKSVCVLGDAAPDVSFAHEFGHLLRLEHEGDIRHLMNGGLSVPFPALTIQQIKTATHSPLAQRFAVER